MAEKKLSELSNEKLLQRRKTLKFFTGVIIGVTIAMVISTAYSFFHKEYSSTSNFPIFIIPLLIISIKGLKETEKEIMNRNL